MHLFVHTGRQKQGLAERLEDTSLPQTRGAIFSFFALHSATSLTTTMNRVCRSAHQAELASFLCGSDEQGQSIEHLDPTYFLQKSM